MNRVGAAVLALALVLTPALGSASTAVPRLTGPVVDEAGLLDSRWTRRLDEMSRAARSRDGGAGPQLQYHIVRTTGGEPIEDYSMRVAEAWKLGTKGKDNGVLVVVALDDRKVRIEVGGGIEGGLTDAQSGRIIRGVIVPAFREKRYGEGLYAAGQQILAALGALPEGMARPAARPEPREVNIPVLGWLLGLLFGLGAPGIIFLVIVIVVLRALFGHRRGPRGPWGGGWGGGGFSGGSGFGGGGGGWSGGGGGFSGGGASGSW